MATRGYELVSLQNDSSLAGFLEKASAVVKSGPSRTSTNVTFANSTDTTVQTFWFNYQGEKVPYQTIKPGKQYVQPTYVLHPWCFEDAITRQPLVVSKKLVVFPDDAAQSVMTISRPVEIEWTQENHARFPPDFQSAVRELLLCYHRSSSMFQVCKSINSLNLDANDSQDDSALKNGYKVRTSGLFGKVPSDVLFIIIKRSAPKVLDVDVRVST